MKILITGSRTLEDKEFLNKSMTDIISAIQYRLEIPTRDLEIVSGHNPRGVDYHGEKWATKNGVSLKLFPAEWNNMDVPIVSVGTNYYGKYNKLAGIQRNTKMLEYILEYPDSICVAFDMGTPGVKDTIAKCKKAGVKVYHFKQDKDKNWKEKIWNG